MRLSTTVLAAALLAGCATTKMTVPTADTYGAKPTVELTAEETALLDGLDAALVRAKLPAAERDSGLTAATRARCIANAGEEPPDNVGVARLLHASGIADTSYKVLDVAGGWAKHEVSAEEYDDFVKTLAPEKGPFIVGACTLADGNASARHYDITLVSRQVDLVPLPRAAAAGKEVVVAGKVHAGVQNAEVYVRDPAGAVTHTAAQDGAISTQFTAAGTGSYVIEIVGTRAGRREVLARAAVAVGDVAAEFPPKPDEATMKVAEAKTATDIRAAVAKTVEALRGSALQQDAKAQDLAAAEAKARAGADEAVAAATADRVTAAGIPGVEVMSSRLPKGDLPLALTMLAQSPYVIDAARTRTVAVASVGAPKGEVVWAMVVGPGAEAPAPQPQPEPAPAAESPATTPPAADGGTAPAPMPAPGSTTP